MSDNYSNLLIRIGELLKEVQEFKKNIISHENEVKKDIEENSKFMANQKDLLIKMKNEINEHNMEYKINPEEITKYIQNIILADFDKHINRKIVEIDKMIKPLVNRVVHFQDAVADLEKTVYDSMTGLRDMVEESNKTHREHAQELDRYSEELADRKVIEESVVTDIGTLEDIITRILNEKLDPIVDILEYNISK